MNLVTQPITEEMSFTSFFIEEAGGSGLYKGNGKKPMVFYRGTQSKKNLFTNLGSLSFTTDQNVAKIYSARPKSNGWDFDADYVEGSTVGSYHLKMNNPIIIDDVKMKIIDFIRFHLGGLKKVGREEVQKLILYLLNRESGKAKGPRFEYDFDYYADEYIDSDSFMGVSIGPSLKSLYATVRNAYDEKDLEKVEEVLEHIEVDTFALIDSPAFKRLAKAAGHDGVIHTDAFDAGPMVSKKLIGKEVGDSHLTYRPFDKSQVIPIKTKSMTPKTSKKTVSEGAENQLDDIDVSSIETNVAVKGYLYHGGKEDDIEELDPYTPSYDGSLGWGLYLAEEDEARNYGRHIYRVPVELKKPFRIEHAAIGADPTGDDMSTRINNDLLDVLRAKNTTFKDWYEKYAGFNADWEHPYGDDVGDAIDEDGQLPKEFIDWLDDEKTAQAQNIAKQIVAIDEWYSKAVKEAMAKGHEVYKVERSKLYEERKKKFEEANSEALENLWDEWPANNIPSIASSALVGEHVPPFWFVLGDEVIGCFDAGDMENISGDVREAGYDSMVVEGLRINSSFLGHEVVLFRSMEPDQVDGKPIEKAE